MIDIRGSKSVHVGDNFEINFCNLKGGGTSVVEASTGRSYRNRNKT